LSNAKIKNLKSPSRIGKSCVYHDVSAGKSSNKNKLYWRYYDEFSVLPIEEQNKILNGNKDLSNNDRSFTI
jgi:hypothetical protein